MSALNPTTACPEVAILRALLDGTLANELQVATQVHVDQCPICEATLRQMTAGGESWIGMAEQLKSENSDDPKLAAAMERLKTNDDSASEAGESADPQRMLDFLQPADDPKLLGKLGQHEISEVVGWGGMGVVLKAYDPSLHRVVAVKVLASHLAHHAVARKRFIREAQAAAAVCHDNVVTIHAIEDGGSQFRSLTGERGGVSPPVESPQNRVANTPRSPMNQSLPKIVMQFVAGGSLQERIDQDGPLELKEILRIAMQTAAGLAAAHAQGVVHRDVKPANILLENGVQRVKLTDFGLARVMDDASLTLSGVIAGTPQYMAPEQAWGRDVDARADLFSLGAVMYAMCSGHSPFRARTTMAVLKRVCEDAPRPLRAINPDIPDWLVAIIEKLLAKNPDERFQTATEVSDLLGHWLAHVQQPNVVERPEPISARRGSPDLAALPDRRPPELSRGWSKEGDLRSNPSAGPGDPRTSRSSIAPDSALLLEKFQRRPVDLRHRLDIFSRLVPVIVLTVFIGGLLVWLFLPSPSEWTSSEALSFGLIGTAAIGAIVFLVAAVLRWFFGVESNEVTQADQVPPEDGTTNETSPSASQLSPKIVVVAMVVTGVVLGFLSISVVETNSRNLPGFLGFSLIQLLTTFATTAAFREAWNTSRWVTWISVLLLLPFVASLFGYLASNQDASGATQFFGGLQALTALAYEFTLLFVRPLFVHESDPRLAARPFRWRRVFALTCVLLVPVSAWVVWRMRMGETVTRPNREVATPASVTLPVDPPASRDPRKPQFDERGFPNPQWLSNIEPIPAPTGPEPGPSDGPLPQQLTKELPSRIPATKWDSLKPLQGRWVVLTLQGDEPPFAPATAGGMSAMMGGGPGPASTPASAVTPSTTDQLRSLEFRDGLVIFDDAEKNQLGVEVHKDRELRLQYRATSESVRHGVFTIADDRLVICWTSRHQPLPRGFQPKPHEQLVVCRREWSRPRQTDGKGNDAVEKFGENSKLPKAEMPFSPREATELQAAWAEKVGSPVEVTNSIGMKFRVIPPGTFGDARELATLAKSMGGLTEDPRPGERGYGASGGVESSSAVNGPILAGTHEVTVAQFRQFIDDSKYVTEAERSMNGQPAKPYSWRKPEIEQDSDQHPVVQVSFADAVAFCHWLSLKEKKPYRLLTRREWEFCARAGSWLPATLGPGKLAFRSQFFTTTAPVGSYLANPFGLHDFIGNVAEWAWHNDIVSENDPRRSVPDTGIWKGDPTVFCGGDFRQHIERSQPSEWLHPVAAKTPPMIGFRVACDLTAASVVSLPKHWPTNQLLLSQELVRVRTLADSNAKSDDQPDGKKPDASTTQPAGKLVNVVWLEMLVRAEQMPYAVEWLDFEIERRATPANENISDFAAGKIEDAGPEVGWKPIDLAPAMQLLEQTEFAPDPIAAPFVNSVLTMPIPKAVSGRWASPDKRGGLPTNFVRLEPAIQKPQFFRFLDFDTPHGRHHYRVRLKYRVPGLVPETVQATSWFLSMSEVNNDLDSVDREPPEDIPVIELKPPMPVDPLALPVDGPRYRVRRRPATSSPSN